MLAGAETLLDGLASGGAGAHSAIPPLPAMRWYVVSERALVLGASQRPPAVDLAACRAAGVAVYQRSAGGTTVLVDSDMLGLDVALPRDHPLLARDLTASYRPVGEAWRAALCSLGVDAAMVDVERARASGRDTSPAAHLARLACFGGLSPYEVTAGDRKVVGLAQVRRRQGALFQTAVQLHFDVRRIAALLTVPTADRSALVSALRDRVAGLDEVMPRPPTRHEIMAAFEGALAGHGLVPVDSAWTAAEEATAARLRAERYRPLQ